VIDEGLARTLGLTINFDDMYIASIHETKAERRSIVSFEVCGIDGKYYKVGSGTTKKGLAIPGPLLNWRNWAKKNPPFIAHFLPNVAYKEIMLFLGLDVEHATLPKEGSKYLFAPNKKFRAYESLLGWTITGISDEASPAKVMATFLSEAEQKDSSRSTQRDLIEEFRAFNDMEAIGIIECKDIFSPAERREMTRMQKLATRTSTGRWEIPMLVNPVSRLPPSENQARKRLASLHRRLRKDERLCRLYYAGIQSNEAVGYIQKLSGKEATKLRAGLHWFLPHFLVFHPDKPEKCRRVLDAAAGNSGVCLNSFLATGPNILKSLFGILRSVSGWEESLLTPTSRSTSAKSWYRRNSKSCLLSCGTKTPERNLTSTSIVVMSSVLHALQLLLFSLCLRQVKATQSSCP
jgi:hypothetical protein